MRKTKVFYEESENYYLLTLEKKQENRGISQIWFYVVDIDNVSDRYGKDPFFKKQYSQFEEKYVELDDRILENIRNGTILEEIKIFSGIRVREKGCDCSRDENLEWIKCQIHKRLQ